MNEEENEHSIDKHSILKQKEQDRDKIENKKPIEW